MNKKILLLPVIVLICIYCYACSGSKIDPNSTTLLTGTYDFTMTDSLAGITLVKGTVSVDTSGDDLFGHYYITSVTDSSFTGYGSIKRGGEYKGHYDRIGHLVSMNMNPRIADANVYLSAAIKGATLNGGWNFSVMRNDVGGLFRATLKL